MPSMGNAAAQLQVVVTADTSHAESGLSSLGAKVQGAGSALAGLAAGAAVAGLAALAAGLAGSVAAAADFEAQMSAISAVSGASASEMEALTSAALNLGKTTSFSASEAANGIEELVKAGVSIQDVLGGAAAASLDLAAAGAISVGEAAEIASNAMNVFGLSGSDMAHVADTIAGAANASAISVNDYKFSLSAAGAVAATVGMSFDDLSTAIALMGNAGIKGSDAGTSLKTMLLNLQPGTAKQTELFKKLGIITEDGANKFFDATGKVRSLADISQVLQDALAGMTDQQKLATLEMMFGSDAIRAAAVVAKAGAEGVNELAGAIGNVTAKAVAAERLNNLKGDFEQLKGSVETFAIMLGSALTPALRSMTQGLTSFVNGAIVALEQLPAAWADVVAAFSGGSGGAGLQSFLTTLGLDGLAPAIEAIVQQVGDAWRTLQQVFAGDWSPSDQINPLINALGQVAIVVRDQVLPAFQTVAGFIIAQLSTVVAWVVTNWPLMVQTFQTTISAIQALWTTFGPTIVTVLQAAWTIITTVISTALSSILALMTAGMQAINGDWSGAWATLTASFQTSVSAWGTIAEAAWSVIQAGFALLWSGLQAAASAGLALITSLLQAGWDMIATTAQGAWDAVVTTIQSVWDTITSTVQGAIDAVSSAIQTGWQSVLDFISGIMTSIQTAIMTVWDAIPEDIRADLVLLTNHYVTEGAAWLAAITTAMTAIQTFITTAWTTITTAVQAALTALQAAITTAWTAIQAAITTAMTTIQAAITTAWAAVQSATAAAWAAILAAIKGPAEQAVAAVQSMGSQILGVLQGLVGTAGAAASAIGSAIVNGIRSAIQAGVASIASAAAAAVRGALDAAKAAANIKSPSKVFRDEVGVPIVEGIMGGIESMSPKLNALLGGAVQPATTNTADAIDYDRLSLAVGGRGASTVNVYGAGTEDVTRKVLGHLRRESLLEVGAFG